MTPAFAGGAAFKLRSAHSSKANRGYLRRRGIKASFDGLSAREFLETARRYLAEASH